MRAKTRILTAFLCLLPPCGVSIASIGQQSQLINPSLLEKAAQGGFSGLNLNTYTSTNKKINLESSQVLSSGTIIKEEVVNNLKIDLGFVDNKISLPEFNFIDSSVPVDSARKIIKEIKIEEDVTNIQGKASHLIDDSRKKLLGRSRHFSQAEDIIASEEKNPRNKKDLEYSHRKVIWDYLSVFSGLEAEKYSLLDSLLRVEGVTLAEIFNNSSKFEKLSKTLQALREIGWIDEPSQIYKHKPKPNPEGKILGPDLGWGDWATQNPYKYFFADQNEWLRFINKISFAEQELFNYLKDPTKTFLTSKLITLEQDEIYKSSFPEFYRLRENIFKAHKELETRIARRLLQDMGFSG